MMPKMFGSFYYWFLVQDAKMVIKDGYVQAKGNSGMYIFPTYYNGNTTVYGDWLLPYVVGRQ